MRARNVILAGLGFALLIVMWGAVPGCRDIPLGNSGHARATSAPFIRCLFPEANGTISYFPKNGPAGKVILWQDVFDGATLLIPAEDTNVLLCLYDFDTCVLLLRINTAKPFAPLPSGDMINNILFASTCEIQKGTSSDWDEVLDYLHKSSPRDFRRHLLPSSFRFRSASYPEGLVRYMSYPGMRQ
jgi:hypothetical protein